MRRLTLQTPLQRLGLLFLIAVALTAAWNSFPGSSVQPNGQERSLDDFTGKVVGVIDGDTIDVMRKGQARRVRLYGIDCPEKGQPYGKAAKQYTSKLSFGEKVTVNMLDIDRYGRTVAEVTLPNGQSLNHELVKAGLAWWYQRYSHDQTMKDLEEEARKTKRGLWAEPEPVPPWEWRKHAQSTTR